MANCTPHQNGIMEKKKHNNYEDDKKYVENQVTSKSFLVQSYLCNVLVEHVLPKPFLEEHQRKHGPSIVKCFFPMRF